MKKLYILLIPFIFSCNSENSSDELNSKKYNSMDETELIQEMDELNLEIRKNVNDAQLYYQRSLIFLAGRDNQGAFADINRAIDLEPDNAMYQVQMANVFVLMGDYRQAETAYIRANKMDSEILESRLKLSEMYVFYKRYDESIGLINQVLRIDKYNADAYFLKGLVYEQLKDTSLAVSSFQTAIEQNPDFFEAYFQVALLLAAQKNPLAISYYDNALRLHPNEIQVYYNKGLLAQELQEFNLALKTYSDLLKIDPNYKNAHFNMGYINMFYLKQNQQGAVHFSNAIKVAPDYHQAYYNRGYCYELMGDVQKAAIDYQNALNVKPDYTAAAKGMERVTNFN